MQITSAEVRWRAQVSGWATLDIGQSGSSSNQQQRTQASGLKEQSSDLMGSLVLLAGTSAVKLGRPSTTIKQQELQGRPAWTADAALPPRGQRSDVRKDPAHSLRVGTTMLAARPQEELHVVGQQSRPLSMIVTCSTAVHKAARAQHQPHMQPQPHNHFLHKLDACTGQP